MNNMKRMKGLIVLIFLAVSTAFSQTSETNEILMTIGKHDVSKSEFERIYRKNNPEDKQNDKKALEEYLDLFINFKLKVIEALEQKLDTNPNFIRELQGYRKQLAAPYLVDKNVDEKLLKEAYERKQWDVRASHILINVDEFAIDTTKAYKKIQDIRKKAIAGENFDTLAFKYSEDPSVKGNFGDLGFFSVFQMVYPFENAAYNTAIGNISEIVRTKFGYHILKVTDKRKAPGEILVAHIMVALPRDADKEQQERAEKKIRDIYTEIINGADFAKMAEEKSDDKASARKGGELPWFGTGRMVPEFEIPAFALKNNGDISEPVKTAFGWHIIKRIDHKPIGSYEELSHELKNRVSKDTRSHKSKTALVEKLKTEYGFKNFPRNLEELHKSLDSTIFSLNFETETVNKYNKPLFTIGDSTYHQIDLVKQIVMSRKRELPEINKAYINQNYDMLLNNTIIAYEEKRLDQKYPDFKYLMQEYHDGILLFDLTDRMVWSKAVTDTEGLEAFHQENKEKYMWGERADVYRYSYSDNKAKDRAIKYLNKNLSKGFRPDQFLSTLNKKSTDIKLVESKFYAEGEDNIIDEDFLKNKKATPAYRLIEDKSQILIIRGIVSPQPKSLNEAKGLVTADYQTYLESRWIDNLRQKYPVSINKEVFNTIKP